MDAYSELAKSILVIKSDPHLKKTFIDVLEIGSYTQQVRVNKITEAIKVHNPPEEIVRFLKLLSDDKIANLVYSELTK